MHSRKSQRLKRNCFEAFIFLLLTVFVNLVYSTSGSIFFPGYIVKPGTLLYSKSVPGLAMSIKKS